MASLILLTLVCALSIFSLFLEHQGSWPSIKPFRQYSAKHNHLCKRLVDVTGIAADENQRKEGQTFPCPTHTRAHGTMVDSARQWQNSLPQKQWRPWSSLQRPWRRPWSSPQRQLRRPWSSLQRQNQRPRSSHQRQRRRPWWPYHWTTVKPALMTTHPVLPLLRIPKNKNTTQMTSPRLVSY